MLNKLFITHCTKGSLDSLPYYSTLLEALHACLHLIEVVKCLLLVNSWSVQYIKIYKIFVPHNILQVQDFGRKYLNKFQDESKGQHWDHQQNHTPTYLELLQLQLTLKWFRCVSQPTRNMTVMPFKNRSTGP